ncbi:MAG: MFS transporter [Verrucomicrobiales bacterium]
MIFAFRRGNSSSQWAGFPPAFWVLVGGSFINRFGTFVMPFLTLYLTGRGFSPTEAGYVISGYGIGALCSSGWGGWLADRVGRNLTMGMALLAGGGCMLALALAESVPVAVVLAISAGLAAEALGPASQALVADLVPMKRRAEAYSIQRIAVNAGFAFGPAVAGWLAQRSFFAVFAADAATSIAFGVIALFLLPRGNICPHAGGGWMPALRSVALNRNFVALCIGCLVANVALRQSITALSLEARSLGYSPIAIGLLFGLNGVLIIFCELPLTRATRHWNIPRTIAAGFALIGLSLGINALGRWWWLPVASIILLTAGEMLCLSRTSAYASNLSPASMRGRYSGVLSSCWWIGYIAGAAPGLWLYEKSTTLLWLASGVCGGLAALAVLAGTARSAARAAKHFDEELVDGAES